MGKVVSVYEAKTHLSKLMDRAEKGEDIILVKYGKPRVRITTLPKKKKIKIGVLKHKAIPNAYKYKDLVGPDPELAKIMEADDPLLHVGKSKRL